MTLNAVHNRVTNPEESWPGPSLGILEWVFDVVVRSSTGDLAPLRFRYLDYPGAFLTSPRIAADERVLSLIERLRGAHGLLVLLDGTAVVDLMDGRPAGQRHPDVTMARSLEIAQQSRCPIHLVVTKWDLLDGVHELGAVRDRLLADPNLGDLVRAKETDGAGTIRLVPVSSVGTGFATRQADGAMQKSGTPAAPHNVEIPLVSVLPDFMQFAHQELTRREEHLDRSPAGSSPLATALRTVGFSAERGAPAKVGQVAAQMCGQHLAALGALVQKRSPMLANFLATHPESVTDAIAGLVERLVGAVQERSRVGQDEFLAGLHAQRLAVRTTREAYEIVEKQFALMLTEFEAEYPDSVIAGGITAFLGDTAEARR